MKSSYLQKLDYSDVIKTICFMTNPKKIIEFGILDGYSLDTFIKNTKSDCQIKAYDIFEEFNGNSAKRDIIKKFSGHNNVLIDYGDFYQKYKHIENNSIDLLHIDIANNGDVYKFTIDNYMSKLSKDGILILEGGSKERDNVEWMIKYEKPKIKPYLESIKNKYDIITIGKVPSITFVKNNDNKNS